MSDKDERGTPGISLERSVKELQTLIEDAHNFIATELEESWEAAERYYKGETDLEDYEGRSNVVKTEVRDAIRNTMPSVMRILLQARKPVTYYPASVTHSAWVEQQSEFVVQRFWECGGYMQLYTAIFEGLKLKQGVLKVYWEEFPKKTFTRHTRITGQYLESLLDDPRFEVTDYTLVEPDTQLGNEPDLFDVEGYAVQMNGLIKLEAVPNYEFFISRNVNSVDQAIERGVHGQRGIISVSEALELGIPDKDIDWLKLDSEDPEQSNHGGSSRARRGYQKDTPNDPSSVDVSRHQFLLSEAYVSFDLKDSGQTQLYKFYLGGTAYKYLHHEEVEDSPFSTIVPNPTPFTTYGDSHADLTMNEQDTSTSLLRAMIDNAHAANNAQVAADPNKTNFDDLMNPAIGAPIRKRSGDTLQIIQTPFTGQGNLAALEYLDRDTQNKTGITKAAQGLDPDALQSTDKDAVLNTIMTSQGQTELIVRNILETGLIRVFKLLLRLSIRHQDPIQMMHSKGKNIPVNIKMFDPDAAALPAVGLGTGAPQQKQMTLNFIYNEQKQVMDKYGPNNPFTSYSQIYNTLEDLVETGGIYDVGRYFNVVTPDIEKAWAKAQDAARRAQAEDARNAAPMDPSKAFIAAEAQKNHTKRLEIAANAHSKAKQQEFEALAKAEELDIKRDQLSQDRVIELAKIDRAAENDRIKQEQAGNETLPTGAGTGRKKST